ncbi:MAG TPA: type I restriction enzyme HsdR N-terminal domain-containing protein [Paludibacteraceae bacterium]|nr:type I restriction enzyme HsdR N-terminal domain-containing protein [Paludibacteraceae bacterium]HPT43746.1 type I restriction enzyme HsdR N-terminal domain-containing protein [Paludibacteraceae bacterium]
MLQLNLPEYQFRLKQTEKGLLILDSLRKRFVKLTPEEWVRQNFLRYLIEHKQYPLALMAVEKQLIVNGLKKRCDAILYDIKGNPMIIIELKAPNIPITQLVFDQVAVYNSKLKVKYFMISNGFEHYCCKVNPENSSYLFFEGIPDYSLLLSDNSL